jgi:hypothetical protein
LARDYLATGLLPRLPTAVLDVGLVIVGVSSYAAGNEASCLPRHAIGGLSRSYVARFMRPRGGCETSDPTALWKATYAVGRMILCAANMLARSGALDLSRFNLLMCRTPRVFAQAALMSLVLIVATTQADDWGRAPFTKDWYAFAAPAPLLRNGTMFVMLSDEAMAYVIPDLPASDSLIRIEGNMPLDPAVGLGKIALARIAVHRGRSGRWRRRIYPLEQSKQRLASFNLAALWDNCLFIGTKAGKLRSCPLTRSVSKSNS